MLNDENEDRFTIEDDCKTVRLRPTISPLWSFMILIAVLNVACGAECVRLSLKCVTLRNELNRAISDAEQSRRMRERHLDNWSHLLHAKSKELIKFQWEFIDGTHRIHHEEEGTDPERGPEKERCSIYRNLVGSLKPIGLDPGRTGPPPT